jgi:Ni,Fe-hydrogenase III small subunit
VVSGTSFSVIALMVTKRVLLIQSVDCGGSCGCEIENRDVSTAKAHRHLLG